MNYTEDDITMILGMVIGNLYVKGAFKMPLTDVKELTLNYWNENKKSKTQNSEEKLSTTVYSEENTPDSIKKG